MATAYHRDQAGAPALAYNAQATSTVHFIALKTILKACLVSGYDGRSAAGWALINEADNFLVLQNGTQSGYVCITKTPVSSGYSVTVYLAQTYTGMSGDVMTGDGVRSGSTSNNATPQRLGITYFASGSAQCSWYVLADERTFIIQNTGYSSLANLNTDSAPFCLYVGEDSAGNFISVGGQNISSLAAPQCYFSASSFTSLKSPSTGLLLGLSAITVYTPSLTPIISTMPAIPVQQVSLSSVDWFGDGVHAGSLRGVVQSPTLMTVSPQFAAASLGATGLNSRTINTPLPLGDEYTYFVASNYSQNATRIVTDNPRFW